MAWGTPAFDAGLEHDDVLTAIDGKPFSAAALKNRKPGDKVTFEVRHVGGTIGTGTLIFGEDPTEEAVLAEAAGHSLSPAQKAFRAAWLGSKQRAASGFSALFVARNRPGTLDDPDVIPRVHRHARHLSVNPLVRHLWPQGIDLIAGRGGRLRTHDALERALCGRQSTEGHHADCEPLPPVHHARDDSTPKAATIRP